MQDLVSGVHFFNNLGRQQHRALFENLRHGQKPEACFITCADSRIVPSMITHSSPGQLFIVRNVGNLIPCYGTSNNGELAAVEYAVLELGIRDIIVCGHTGCGAMKALVAADLRPADGTAPAAPPQRPLTSVVNWLRHAESTAEIIRTHYAHLSGSELVDVAAEENVLVQLEHLRTLPVLAARASTGDVRLHGWMYNVGSGEVFHFDAEAGQFVRFGDDAEQVAWSRRISGADRRS